MTEGEEEFIEFIISATNDRRLLWEYELCKHDKVKLKSSIDRYDLSFEMEVKGSCFFWVRSDSDTIENQCIYQSKGDNELYDMLISKIVGKDFKWKEKPKDIFTHMLEDTGKDFMRDKEISVLIDEPKSSFWDFIK